MKIILKTLSNTRMKNFIAQIAGLAIYTIIIQSCATTVYTPAYTNEIRREEVTPPPQPPPPPAWAPPYDDVSEVHYYYLPDYEVYYDVWNREYIYLEDGNWVFSYYMPPAYANYDLNNAFVVVLDYQVREPWRQHQLYASHYPRYYYRTVYYNSTTANNATIVNNNGGSVRGFNENARRVIYDNRRAASTIQQPMLNEQERTRPAENNSIYNEPASKSSNTVNTPQRNVYNEPTSKTGNRTESTQNNGTTNNVQTKQPDRRVQPAVYSGKEIGTPVKVDKSMKQPAKQNTKQQDPNKKDNKDSDNRR
jgi:hypothetical protein